MTLFGLSITRTKSTPPDLRPPQTRSGGGGWVPIVRESYTGAWQQNVDVRADSALAYFAVFSCITLIAADIGKLTLRLVQQDGAGIWTETASNAFSPVLRRPNRYQTINKFIEQWITSKLIAGNTYVLKQRDARGVVVALYVLNPARVHPLVAADGGVYYALDREELIGDLPWPDAGKFIVPASEIIHDTMVCLAHPLIGVSPIFASGLAASQGTNIQNGSTSFFANGSQPGGVLTAPGAISDATAAEVKQFWKENFTGANVGSVAVLGDGLHYEPMTLSAADAQLIEQLKWTADVVCSTYHVPGYMIGIGTPPPYANMEPLLQQYYAQCLQSLITNFETSLDNGLGLTAKIDGTQYGTEFDIDDLIWMDSKSRSDAAQKSSGVLAPNEQRRKFYGVGPATGGDSPMVQQQYFSLDALAQRDAADPFAKPVPPTPPPDITRGALVAAIRKRQTA